VDKNQKQPYYLYKNDGIMKLAGLYDKWVDSKGEEMYTYTILTTEISPGLKWLHTRMPVSVKKNFYVIF
jgi:putative SOS response-associated peptidase YedK